MKALLLSSYRHLELADLPEPAPGPGEVLIRVAACGICGSDVHGYDGSSGRRIPPLVMGHEAAGIVAAAGVGVTNFAPGDRVTFDSTVHCGECANCRRGDSNLCDRRQVLGVSCGDYRRAGAFAEFVAVPARICYRLPADLPFAEAAMLEAVAVAIHAVNLARLQPDTTALVIGAGTIGVLTLQALRAAGCERVFVTDVDRERLAMARQLGATETLLADAAVQGRLLELSAKEVKAAPNHLHRHGFRRRLWTTVPRGRLVGVIGVSHSSPGLDEAESAHVGRDMRVDNSPRADRPQIITAVTNGSPVGPEREIQDPSSAMRRGQDGRRLRLVP